MSYMGTYMYMYIYIYVRIICVYMYMYIYVNKYMYIHTDICICLYIYIRKCKEIQKASMRIFTCLGIDTDMNTLKILQPFTP